MADKEGKTNKEAKPEGTDYKKELGECQKLRDEYLAGWQRERADFLNYKKKEMERIEELVKYASEGLILNILPILDNFDIAEKKLPEDVKGNKNVKGILQIRSQMLEFLKSQGVEEIHSLGKEFDPKFMEVSEMVEEKKSKPGIVIEEIQRGYKIDNRVLRPAKVKVAK